MLSNCHRVPSLVLIAQAVFLLEGRHTHNTQPFYGSVEFVRENPGEPVPEETFRADTHTKSQPTLITLPPRWDNNNNECKCLVFTVIKAVMVSLSSRSIIIICESRCSRSSTLLCMLAIDETEASLPTCNGKHTTCCHHQTYTRFYYHAMVSPCVHLSIYHKASCCGGRS